MIAWLVKHLGVFVVRLGLTLVACITLQGVIHNEGYRCELPTLLVGAAVTIVTLRLWLPWTRDT